MAIDFTGFETEDIKFFASKLFRDYGPFQLKGQELLFPNNPQLTKADLEPLFLDLMKLRGKQQIDTRAELARATILTPGDGKKTAYFYKYEEAKAVKALPDNVDPDPQVFFMLAAEVPLVPQVTNIREMANLILTVVDRSKRGLSAIEVRAISLKNEIDKAKNIQAVKKVVNDSSFSDLLGD